MRGNLKNSEYGIQATSDLSDKIVRLIAEISMDEAPKAKSTLNL